MHLIKAPEPLPETVDLFLAGGISNCPDWQSEMIELLEDTTFTVLNPRRPFYSSKESASIQIEWEFKALRKAKMVSFWFPSETLCPITLYELGVLTERHDVPVFVGAHPEYARLVDLEVQLRLTRPEIQIVHSVEALVQQVKHISPV